MTKSLLEEFEATGVSYTVASKDLDIPRSTLHAALHGSTMPKVKEVVPLVKLWLKEQRTRKIFKTASMSRFMAKRGASIAEAAKAIALDPAETSRMISTGEWDSEERFKKLEAFLDEKKYGGKPKMLTQISLSEEVRDYFGLKRDPFTNEMESNEDVLDTKELSRAEKKIMTAAEKGGWIAVTGPIGSGKSILIKKVESKLKRRGDVALVKPQTIEKQYLGASHVCDSILQDLGTSSVLTHRTLEFKARLVGRTLEEAYKDGKRVIVLIDEAHLLRPDALLALKRIYEFEIGFRKLLAIILVGQPPLAKQLRTNFTLAEVSQRVDLHELHGLNGTLGLYLRHKLERAGCSRELFDGSAVKAIGERFDTPLMVNNIAGAALIAAHDQGQKQVTGEIVKSIQGTY